MLAVPRQLAHAPIVLVGRTCLDRTLRRGRRALRRSTVGSGGAAIATAPVASQFPTRASSVTFLVRFPRDSSLARANEVRTRDQFEDREDPWAYSAALTSRAPRVSTLTAKGTSTERSWRGIVFYRAVSELSYRCGCAH